MNTTTQQVDESKAKPASQVPASLADVELVDIDQFCAAGGFCRSYLRGEIRAKRAPEPLRFGPRCSRWPADVARQYLRRRIEQAASDGQAAQFNSQRAKKASDAARSKTVSA